MASTTPDDVLDVAPELAPLNVPRAPGRPSRLLTLITDVALLLPADWQDPEASTALKYLVAHVAVMTNPQYMKLGPNQSVSVGGVSRTKAALVSTVAALEDLDATGYGTMAKRLMAGLPSMLVT